MWPSELHCHLQCEHAILDCWLKSQLLNFPSSFLLKCLAEQQWMAQVLKHPPFMWKTRMEFLALDYNQVLAQLLYSFLD